MGTLSPRLTDVDASHDAATAAGDATRKRHGAGRAAARGRRGSQGGPRWCRPACRKVPNFTQPSFGMRVTSTPGIEIARRSGAVGARISVISQHSHISLSLRPLKIVSTLTLYIGVSTSRANYLLSQLVTRIRVLKVLTGNLPVAYGTFPRNSAKCTNTVASEFVLKSAEIQYD